MRGYAEGDISPTPKGRKGREMPENAATVDSVEAQAAVDSAAENAEVNPSAEDSSPKTFTADELDARIKARIDKQRAKYDLDMQQLKAQMEEMEKRAASAETERDELLKAKEMDEWKAAAAAETGVPAALLRGSTADEINEHAAAIRAAFNAPIVRDSGEHRSVAPTKESILAIPNEKERLEAIRANAELFK